MINRLVTDNLVLRKARKEDLQLIWDNVWSDKELANYMLWNVTTNRKDAEIRMEKTIKYQSDNFAYFICLKDTDEPIGFAGIIEKEIGIYEETGICIAKKYQGKGYGKEVVSALKKLIFSELGGKKFIYGCFSTNEISKRVCLAQGFKYLNSEPRIRESDGQEYVIDYFYFDKDMYVMEDIIKKVMNEVKEEINIYKIESEDKYDFWENHIKFVYNESIKLANIYHADLSVVKLGALLHDIALIKKVGDRKDHHLNGATLASEILSKYDIDNFIKEKVIGCVFNHRSSNNSTNLEELCVADADILAHFDNIPMLFNLAYNRFNVSLNDIKDWMKKSFEDDYNDLSDRTKEIFKDRYVKILDIVLGVR